MLLVIYIHIVKSKRPVKVKIFRSKGIHMTQIDFLSQRQRLLKTRYRGNFSPLIFETSS